ncbi:hypothetical protein [Lysobacter terrae]
MKPFTTLACLLLAFIAAMQLMRFALGWTIIVNGFTVPVWASAVAAAITGTVAIMTWRERRH